MQNECIARQASIRGITHVCIAMFYMGISRIFCILHRSLDVHNLSNLSLYSVTSMTPARDPKRIMETIRKSRKLPREVIDKTMKIFRKVMNITRRSSQRLSEEEEEDRESLIYPYTASVWPP
eukprot:4281356-Karenia_brevis.AAC.1